MVSLTTELIIGFSAGIVLLLVASSYLIKSVETVSKKMKISYFLLGFLIMAIGTSLPEISVSFASSVLGRPAFSLANILGSNLADICVVIGAAAFFGLKVDKKVANATFIFLGFSLLLMFFLVDGALNIAEGAMLLALGVVYFYFITRKETGKAVPVEMKKEPAFFKSYFYIPIFIFWLIIASFLIVTTGTFLAVRLGIPISFIGFALLAVGTALPEALSTVIIMLRGHAPEFVWGTLLGGNIVNIFLGVGAGPIFGRYKINFGEFFYQFLFMIIATAVLGLMMKFKKKLDWKDGIILILIYAAAFYFVITGQKLF